MKSSKVYFLILILFLIVFRTQTIISQELSDKEDIVLLPPYLVNSSNFLMTMFNLQVEDVQNLLPEDVQAKINDNGTVTAGFEMYTTSSIQGLPAFTVAFIFVEVIGLNSENNTPGHWAIWGNVDNKIVLKNFQNHFGFPYEYEENMIAGIKDNKHFGTIGINGNEKVNLEIEFNINQPLSSEGIVNMCGKTNEGQIVISEVPWISKGCTGTLIKFKINPQTDRTLEILEGVEPFWAMISTDQIFCYSKPIKK